MGDGIPLRRIGGNSGEKGRNRVYVSYPSSLTHLFMKGFFSLCEKIFCMKTYHRIKIDIPRVSYRTCRPYQEKIDDFYESGKIRFQWDMIKQAFLLGQDSTLPVICSQCPLNIFQQPEGCQGDIVGLNIFLKVLARFKADAELLKYQLFDDILDIDGTRNLLNDMLESREYLEKLDWPVAQVHFKGVPVTYTGEDGIARNIFYEWDGEEEETYPHGQEGYFWGRSQEGIVVKDNFGNKMPFVFNKLYKEGFGVYGASADGRVHTFVPVMGHFPSWDDVEPGRQSELMATEIKASLVFGDILDILRLFSQEALKNNTGLSILSLG